MGNPNRLTTREVARICRVSDATVKRWASAGLIDSEKTKGGHRRFRAEEVATFQSKNGLGLSNQSGDISLVTALDRSRIRKEHGGTEVFNSLICGCEEEVANHLIKHVLDGVSIEAVFDEVLCPELNRIGRLWMEGKISVAEEHLASRTVLYALYKLRKVIPASESNHKLAICCGIEGDHHALPTDFARLVFETYGWTVLNFGPNTPLFSATIEIKKNKPELLCLSATLIENLDRVTNDFSDLVSVARSNNCKIIVGGRGFADERIRDRFPADYFPSSFSDLSQIITSW